MLQVDMIEKSSDGLFTSGITIVQVNFLNGCRRRLRWACKIISFEKTTSWRELKCHVTSYSLPE